jgi:diamine N-acetyltransferase
MNIFLREIERDDLARINGWRADREIVGSLGGAYRFVGREAESNWFDAYLASRANNVRLAICLAENREMVGVAYLLGIDWINRSCEFALQIGDAAFRGKGVGEAATRRALEHAFLDLNLERVHLTVLANNHRAIALYKKVCFVEEGRLRQATFKNGRYVDLIQMSILRVEFVSAREQ